MKKIIFALLSIAPLSMQAQQVYFTGGYVLDRPTVNDGMSDNIYLAPANGYAQIDKIKQSGFFVGTGMFLKAKKTSTFGLRAEIAYERLNQSIDRSITMQESPFTQQNTFSETVTAANNYLRLSPTISWCKLQRNKRSYQADLGISQAILLGGWNENSSFTAVHVSGGIGHGGILVKAGAEVGVSNTLAGEAHDYKAYSKRFFAGIVVYPSLLKKAVKQETEAEN